MTLDRLWSRWTSDERLRFLAVGGWNTLVGYVAFLVLYAMLQGHLHYLLIGVMAHAIAVVNAFVVHRTLVFRSKAPWGPEFLRFNVAQLFVLGFGLATLWLFVSLGRFHPLVGQGLATICSVAMSYCAHRRFSFASSR